MKSVMQHQFSRVPSAEIQRSSFDRSHGYKTTFDAGYLVPFYIDEALPGDTFNLRAQAFARLATPLKPVMDNMFMETFFFSVPIRLVWNNWEKFNGAQTDPDDSTDYVVPQMTRAAGVSVGTLSDYFGIPTSNNSTTFNSLWHRAYNLIWNEWFRDQNLQDSLVVDKDDGPDNYDDYVLKRRGKRHDYFTSCLPFPQKGPDVQLPLGVSAPIEGIGNFSIPGQNLEFRSATSGAGFTFNLERQTIAATDGIVIDPDNDNGLVKSWKPAQTVSGSVLDSAIQVDLSEATAASINVFREAFQLQRLYERDARGGTRYCEIVKSHFGVTDPMNAVLQRPVYLGGGSSLVNLHPVAATNKETSLNIGDLGAFGTAAFGGHGFTQSFTEHCLLIGLVCVRADLTYQQGMDRMFSRRTRYDFYWPALSHLGEQAVLNKEIYYQGGAAPTVDEEVFGYQERYGDYRYKQSRITGLFKSTYTTPLDMWHLSQEFSALPTLSDTFIQEDPPVDRVIAVPSEPHFLFDSYISLKCARPMPVYGVPGMIDHF